MHRTWKPSLFARAIMRTRPVRQRQKQKDGAKLKVEAPSNPAAAKADGPYDAPFAGARLQPDTYTSAADETSISQPQPFVLKFLVMTDQELAVPKTIRGTSEIVSNTSVAETDHPKLKAGAHAAKG
jgi:hypothetical protein